MTVSMPTLPAGTVLHTVMSDYHGHPDGLGYGEGNETCYLAVPEGAQIPQVGLIHGTLVRCWRELLTLPAGTHILIGNTWKPVREYLEDEQPTTAA